MDKHPFPNRALTFGLATFHTVFFVVFLVLLLYSRGILGSLLAGLNTLTGYAVFGVLWGTTWWTTRRALRGYLKGIDQDGGLNWTAEVLKGQLGWGWVVARGVIWGGVNGFLFLIALALILAIYFLALTIGSLLGAGILPDASLTLILLALIGSPLGAVVGGVTGFILAIIDSAVLGVVRRFFSQ
jgi:hypothetical protein